MSREEAIKIFNTVLFFGKCDAPKEELEECLKMAIKALKQEKQELKQESVLDKVKAEIEQVRLIMDDEIKNHDRKDLINFVNGLNQSLMIIDKYKAESEV